jgi:hypothetical protein
MGDRGLGTAEKSWQFFEWSTGDALRDWFNVKLRVQQSPIPDSITFARGIRHFEECESDLN